MDIQEENLTPAMMQYYDIKKQYPDCMVFFRMGDFYEMFGEDAHIANRVLGISITTRNKNAKEPIPLAGIPYHAKEKYLPRLVEAGYKVAIVEQVSDPKLKGIVKREVTRIVTPSTLRLEGESYESTEENSYIISIIEENGTFSISTLNVSDNDWKVYETSDKDIVSQILYKIHPQEVLLEKEYTLREDLDKILKSKYNLSFFFHNVPKNPRDFLLSHFGCVNLTPFGIEDKKPAQKSASMLLSYLEENQKGKLPFLNSIRFERGTEFMQLDESTIRSLDIFYNFSTKSELQGTLLGILSKTKTVGGKRTLRKNLMYPLLSKEEIEKRLTIIEEIKKSPILLANIREQLSLVSDIDSILNRISLDRTNPRDLLALKRSLEAILVIQKLIFEQGSEKLKSLTQSMIDFQK